MSELGRFVPYHLQCCYNLTETAGDRLLVRIPPAYDRLSVFQGFLSEQEPIFTYKSSTFLDDPETALWVVSYLERVVRVCAALLRAVYREHRLWYVPKDIVAFSRERGFSIKVPLRSRANVREVLELLDVIEATDFTPLPEQWCDRQLPGIDYHPGRTTRGGDFVYYNPWRRHKMDGLSARMSADSPRILPDDLKSGLVNPEEDVERTPHDDIRDYHPSYGWHYSQFNACVTAAHQDNTTVSEDDTAGPSSATAPASDDTAVVRRFLEDASVVRNDEGPMILSEIREYVRGRLMR